MKAKEICGDNGSLYYCDSEETISCGDGSLAFLDGKSYKCLSEDEYLMNIFGRYDYPCIEKFNRYPNYNSDYLKSFISDTKGTYNRIVISDENNVDINQDLLDQEKQCVPTKLDTLYSDMISSRNNDLPSKYDVRDKVKVTAGDQGKSDTCTQWSRIKALEISAQLKGINYQFLLNFESKINSLNVNTNESLEASLKNRNLIPGNWKFIGDDFDDYDDSNITYLLVPEEIDNYLVEYRYFYPDDANKYYDKYFQDIEITRTKHLVIDYGNAFIWSPKEKFNHQMVIIGWDDSKQSWLALNSWGNSWSGYNFKSNGDGTTWIKYNDEDWFLGSANAGYAIELMGE